MSDEYLAVRTARDDFVRQYPDAVAEPVGKQGFAAFGNGPVQLAEALGRPDFDDTQLVLVLARDKDLYLAFASPGEVVGHPPAYVRLRVTNWGPNIDPESVRKHVRTERDVDVWSGTVVSELEGLTRS